MSFNLKIFIISIYIIISHSETEFSSCIDGIRKILLEDGETKEHPCISCPENQYTTFDGNNETNPLTCSNCPLSTFNYGQDIIINSFSEKILSRYLYTSSQECNGEKNDELCPEWKINPLSLRVDSIKDINSKSFLQ